MSIDDEGSDELTAIALAGTPQRIVDVTVPPEAHASIDTAREALSAYARATVLPVTAPPAIRDALKRSIASHPRTPRRAALIVLDMIVDYLTPGRPLHVPRAVEIVPAVRACIESARRAGTPVVYLCDHHEPGDPDLETWPLHAVQGTPRERVVAALAPHDDELVIPHRTYSAFFESTLEASLRALDVNTLVLTGCATEIGLLATATDALMRGFVVEVPPETQAGSSEIAERVALGALHVMRPLRSDAVTTPHAPAPPPSGPR